MSDSTPAPPAAGRGALTHDALLQQWMPRLFEWSDDAIVLLDPDHVVVDGNAAAERLLCRSMTELVGRKLLEFVAPHKRHEADRVRRLVDLEMTDGSVPGTRIPLRFEWTIDGHPDGPRHVMMTVSCVRDGLGGVLGYGLVAQDLTPERRAEQQQRALAQLSSTALKLNDVRSVFDAAVAIPVTCLDADHVTLFELRTGPRRLVSIAQAGWPRPELLRSLHLEVWPGSDLDEVLTTQRPHVIDGPWLVEGSEIPGVVADMGARIGSAVNVVVSSGGEPWGVLCASWVKPRTVHPGDVDTLQTVANVVSTVIERERNDELRLQHERTLRLGSLGQMAAGVAHDLANVLAGIEALVTVEATRPGMSAEGRHNLRQVRAEAQLGHQIIEEILDFARLAPLEPEPVHLGRWLAAQQPAIVSAMPERVHLVVDTGGLGGGPVVHADVCGLRRVLDNLVVNGVEAISGAGTVTIRVGAEHVGAADVTIGSGVPSGDWARLEVSDDGVGIDPESVPRIFEPFFTTKKHRRGTGLGLAQVHGLTFQHGGQVTVTSALGEGTTFTVWLPVAG